MFDTFKQLECWFSEKMDELTEKSIDQNWSSKRLDREQAKLDTKFHELSKAFYYKDSEGNFKFSPTRIK